MKITIKNLQKKIPVHPLRIKKALLKALKKEGWRGPGEISLSFVNDSLITRLNCAYLKKRQATDVLAFDLSPEQGVRRMCADIIVSADTARRNAALYKTSADHELELYSVHGLLHLLGYEDKSPADRKLMRKKELEYVHT